MTQFGSSSSSSSMVSLRAKKHKSKKVSLFCILSTLLAISISTLLLFLRFYDASTRSSALQLQQEHPEQLLLPTPQQRKTVQQLEQEEYMRTGRKPKGMDPHYSQRQIQKKKQAEQEDEEEEEEEDALLMPKEEKAFSNFAKVTRKTKSSVTNPPTTTTKPLRQKKTHFFQDFPPQEKSDHQDHVMPDPNPGAQTATTATAIAAKNINQNLRNKPYIFPKTITPLLHPTSAPLELFDAPTIHFMNISQVSMQDSFSASWFQRKQEFMDMPLDKIMICEDAAWEAWKSFPERLRMTVDVLDFSVEHLSKWWKFMTFWKTDVAYETLMSRLHTYIVRGKNYPTPPQQPMLAETLSMIAFQPYLHKTEQVRHYNLTVVSLAATIESIRRAQMGRVVVVGLVDNGQQIAQDAFSYLAKHVPDMTHTQNAHGIITHIGHLQVAYAPGSKTIAKSKHLAKNIPRTVLFGTRLALELGNKPKDQLQPNETEYVETWLGKGDPSYWKYLYLTEPDTLLNARSIPQLKAQADQGRVLAPHRLQPIPHESDLQGLANKFRYLNQANGFDHVWELDVVDEHDVCCDEQQGPDHKPGKTDFEDCGTWWYMCGFKKDFNDKSLGDVHERLRPYQFMKLKQGTGLTLLSGNLFGRRCFPAKKSFCKPPYVKD
ncbi:expressed unknown protein [Seminavis robusta]|uniref:Uncharacterized protein n=1 Tax=Seminavis robusta TaxID=568900 RepID=A0A9N8DKG1_9STRA|nr:expressed unknown protein [Seminavis robusta]|eukprot:Sro170_g075530.1 n/a (658) ;mRNA; r:81840-83910